MRHVTAAAMSCNGVVVPKDVGIVSVMLLALQASLRRGRHRWHQTRLG